MKINIFTLIIPVLFFASVCFADYGAMKKELKDYTPQDSVAIRQSPDIAVQKTPSHPAVPLPAGSRIPDRSQIHNLKQGYEKQIYGPNGDAAAMGGDEKILARVSQTGDDPNAFAARLAQKIDLEEIKAIAALRNTDIKAAQKKVLAESQSFDQVTHLDDSLHQYAAFTAALDNRVGPLKA
ncbi:MAG: hypothetical protein K9K63_15210, partial [Desulfotignum sp.]|nr:hypothetical protein [Desulfotignum sp.]